MAKSFFSRPESITHLKQFLRASGAIVPRNYTSEVPDLSFVSQYGVAGGDIIIQSYDLRLDVLGQRFEGIDDDVDGMLWSAYEHTHPIPAVEPVRIRPSKSNYFEWFVQIPDKYELAIVNRDRIIFDRNPIANGKYQPKVIPIPTHASLYNTVSVVAMTKDYSVRFGKKYILLDTLYKDGVDYTTQPMEERRSKSVLKGAKKIAEILPYTDQTGGYLIEGFNKGNYLVKYVPIQGNTRATVLITPDTIYMRKPHSYTYMIDMFTGDMVFDFLQRVNECYPMCYAEVLATVDKDSLYLHSIEPADPYGIDSTPYHIEVDTVDKVRKDYFNENTRNRSVEFYGRNEDAKTKVEWSDGFAEVYGSLQAELRMLLPPT